MQISAFTISVLEHFSVLNNGIFIKEGSVIETINPAGSVIAKATVETMFPHTFALHDLDKFVSVLKMGDNPEVFFTDKFIRIHSNGVFTVLNYSDERLVDKVPDKKVRLPSVDITATIRSDIIRDVKKALQVLELRDIVISGDGKSIAIKAVNFDDPTSDTHSIRIGDTDKTFNAVFPCEDLQLMPDEYEVSICRQGIARFKAKRLEYFIVLDDNSTF